MRAACSRYFSGVSRGSQTILALLAGLALFLAMSSGLAAAPAADAAASHPAQFSVLNRRDQPVEWGGVLIVAIKGTLPGDGADPTQWVVALNGVMLHVATVFVQPTNALPPPDDGAAIYSLVLKRPDLTDVPVNQSGPDVAAATIRRLAPDRWGVSVLTVDLTFAGQALVSTTNAGIPVTRRNLVAFRVASPVRIGICLGIVILLIGTLAYAWARTGAFRDDFPMLPYHQRLFSLGRVQFAFWTVLVVGGYLFLYLTTGQFNGLLNGTAGILLGISAATTVLSGVTDPPPPGSPVPAPVPATPQVHVNWLVDILSDSQGVNLHRLQMVVWTAVFGLIFVSQLLNQFRFPVFDQTAYVLMGISSTTYIWFKRNEP